MILLIALLAATGILLLVSGLPGLRHQRIARRVDPFLSGLHGRPSALLAPAVHGARHSVRLKQLVARVLAPSEPREGARLTAAGYHGDATDFRFEQIAWGVGAALGACIVLTSAVTGGMDVQPLALPLLVVIGFAGGFLGRDWWLGRQTVARMKALEEDLPTAIDLVTLSIMAGESVPAAFARVASVLPGELGRELGMVVTDIRGGSTTSEALDEMGRRIPVAGVGRFCDALVTGIDRGTPLADVLRAQAEDGREARRRWLLVLGGRREVLMLVPVVFLILPVVIVFTLLPGLVALDLFVP